MRAMENFVFISPNFPPRYFKWCEALAARGLRVLGIGDCPYDQLEPRLKSALTEYYWVSSLSDYPSVERACLYFEKKYGCLSYIESMNEWWLEQDAKLREEFHVNSGFHPEEMRKIKAKSAMKRCFAAAGAKTIPYLVVSGPEDKEEALSFAKRVGYPLFAKPDVGVGAAHSGKIEDEPALSEFLSSPLPEPFILEQYVSGEIVSFDGVCDGDSNVVFCTSDHFPVVPGEIVAEKEDHYYYTAPFSLSMDDVDAASFLETGKRVVKAFGIKKRFFHIEFFLLGQDEPGIGKKGDFAALECNMRAPGGFTPDLIDFAESASCFFVYADVIAYGENREDMGKEKYYAFCVCRRDCYSYAHSDAEVRAKYSDHIRGEGRYPASISDDMGDSYYLARFKSKEEGVRFADFVREKAD